MFADLISHRFDLCRGAQDRFRASNLARHPDREKYGVQSAFLHSWDVDAAVGVSRAEIEAAIHQALRGVVVGVHNDRRKMQLAGVRGEIVSAHARLQSDIDYQT